MSAPDRPGTAHAVVIGASIAGLLAARVLSERFEQVTVVERDELPAEPQGRGGVPQAKHFHQLLSRGQQVMEELLPGLGADVVSRGGQLVDTTEALRWLTPAGWAPRYRSGINVLGVSRDLLEWAIRQRVAALDRVRVLDRTETVGLVLDDTREVRGVTLRRRGSGAEPEELRADLVVDASGRGSKVIGWLGEAGYDAPDETIVDVGMGYASRFYRIPDGFAEDWKAIYVQAAPPTHPRSGIMIEVEGGRWLVSVNGVGADAPPTDDAGFLAYLRGLRDPALYEALRDAEPASPVAGFRHTGNRLRKVHQVDRWPTRLIVLGDALCSFNPVYGQGMTVASLQSLILRRLLADGFPADLAKRFQRETARLVAGAFTMATGEDYRFGAIDGVTPGAGTRFMHWYFDRITALKVHDRAVNDRFVRVLHMLDGPQVLFHPGVVAKAITRR
ncbi:2-polyprenyl-6-methoxyphenol hydroxylase-like FAD-dependent oxidoreductase [Allocatelliglobosispora scoriae]|uniref:2-polyprenyl-6-methoxyphenol hydroxylase-like FAD-dependent oxidoreductase n=1 Tax=Allocatelliglobosispora scoriae TaxID=643052 RepID=A0A841BZ57_9ACTN|nr:tryptophan 7-halogenase [Allocatelliglobosispora scoriae]MBB5874427.1 2-polyprenyl-6-methoxyphenol hydroxylase-like FAD-dependent oxidoreductase [Allocatelliglobosispora scoriae]